MGSGRRSVRAPTLPFFLARCPPSAGCAQGGHAAASLHAIVMRPRLHCSAHVLLSPGQTSAMLPCRPAPLPPFPSLPPWINWPPCSKTRCRPAAASPPPRCSRAAGIPAPLRRRWRSKSRCAAALPRCPRVRAAPGDSQLLHPIVSAGKTRAALSLLMGPRCGAGGAQALAGHLPHQRTGDMRGAGLRLTAQ
jgi:hypothetical protein